MSSAAALERDGFYETYTLQGLIRTVFTRALFEDGRKNQVLAVDRKDGAPVHIIQGIGRPGVPWPPCLAA